MELQKWAVRNISRDISDTLFCFFSFLGGKLPMSTAYKYIFSAKHEDSEIFELYCMRTVIMFIVISLMLTSSFCWGWRLQCPAGKIQVCYPKPIHLHGSAAVQHLQSVLHSPPGRLQPAEGCEQWWPALAWSGVVFGIAIVGVWYWCSDQVNVVMTLVLLNHIQIRNDTWMVLLFCRWSSSGVLQLAVWPTWKPAASCVATWNCCLCSSWCSRGWSAGFSTQVCAVETIKQSAGMYKV